MARKKRISTAQPLLLTIPDVAIMLGVCRAMVYNLIYRHGLPIIEVAGSKRVHPESLDNWIRGKEIV